MKLFLFAFYVIIFKFFLAPSILSLGYVSNVSQSVANLRARKIYVLGDVHGDYNTTVNLIEKVGLIDAARKWKAKDATFVQLGDIVDRGPDGKEIFELMKNLQEEAALVGGRVHLLYGNHELLNLHDNYMYVHAEDIARYGGKEERMKEWSAQGSVGKFLRQSFNATVVINRDVFVHAGILPVFAQLGVDRINTTLREAILSDNRDAYVVGNDGPCWTRILALGMESNVCPMLYQSLAYLDADRMFVGHTIQQNGRVNLRCEGRLVLIDTAVSRWVGGIPSITFLSKDKEVVCYMSHERELVTIPLHKHTSLGTQIIALPAS